MILVSKITPYTSAVPNLFGTRTGSVEDNFFHGPRGLGDDLGMIHAHRTDDALYFYYCYYISFTSERQALDP